MQSTYEYSENSFEIGLVMMGSMESDKYFEQ